MTTLDESTSELWESVACTQRFQCTRRSASRAPSDSESASVKSPMVNPSSSLEVAVRAASGTVDDVLAAVDEMEEERVKIGGTLRQRKIDTQVTKHVEIPQTQYIDKVVQLEADGHGAG